MNNAEINAAIQEQSKQYITDLEKLKSTFENAVTSFLTSNVKTCLVIKTRDTRLGVIRLMEMLQRLRDDSENHNELEKYLSKENQSFLSWNNLSDIVRPLEYLPKLSNLLVCEFPQSLKIKKVDKTVLNKITDRLNIAVSKKVVFIMSQKGSLDEHIKNIDMQVFLKIDEFENKVDSMTYANNSEALIQESSKGHVDEVNKLLTNGIKVYDTDKAKALLSAAEKGHRDVVITLLNDGVNVNATDYGNTALHEASKNGHKEVVVTLLRKGASIKCEHYQGASPLHLAASEGHTDIVTVLFDNDVDVNMKLFGVGTPLELAVANGHINMVHVLLDHGADINAARNNLLYVATEKNNLAMVKTLLENKVEIKNDLYQLHESPLRIAARNGNKDIVSLLLEHGVEVNVKNYLGDTALSEAISGGHSDVVNYLLEHGADIDIPLPREKFLTRLPLLHRAACKNNVEIVKALLTYGADINSTDTEENRTPLHCAASNGELKIVECLLDRKADFTLKDKSGKTALNLAACKNNVEIVKALLTYGADIDSTDTEENRTSLHCAASNGQLKIVECLLDKGAAFYLKDKSGKTALDLAMERRHKKVVALLKKPRNIRLPIRELNFD